MLKLVLAVVIGLLVGMAVNIGLIMLNNVFFPLPEGVAMSDPAQMRAAVADMPSESWIGVIAAHLGQSFFGGWVAAWVGKKHPIMLAMIVGVISLAGGVWNAISLSTPAWTWVEMPLYLLVAWLAGHLVARRRKKAD